MNTFLHSAVIFLLSFSIAFAQEIRIAPVVGINTTFANMSKDMKELYDVRYDPDLDLQIENSFPPAIGFQIGGLAGYSVNENFELQSGLLLSVKGFAMKYKTSSLNSPESGSDMKAKSKTSVSFLEIPILATFALGESGFKISAGPGLGFALAAKAKGKATVDGETEKYSNKVPIGNDAFSRIKVIDLNLQVAVSKAFEFSGSPLEVSLFAQPSITNWQHNSNFVKGTYLKYFNSGLRAAYYFSIR